ncbi:MAG: o-succinylbenzoate synthase [Nesterenkonia sp.]
MTSVPLPAVDEIIDTAVVVSVPMRTRFRGQTSREVMLFRGPAGWAEFGPFPEYQAHEASHWLAAGVEAAYTGLGAPLRDSVPVNATVPAVAADQVSSVLAQYGNPDAVPAVKIKVAEPGQTIDDDVARVRAVRKRLPDVGLRVDANGAWSLDEAVRGLGRIVEAAGGELEYAEQPVAGVEPLARLREALQRAGVQVRIAADEAVRKAEDPLRVARLGAADLIVVKAAPLGGVQRALEVVAQSGLDAVVSSALDTSVGLTAGLALAARLPQLPYACGLGTAAMFTSELVDRPLAPTDGQIPVPVETVEKGSTGQAAVIRAPEPNPELLQRHRVSADRQQWWRTRVRTAHQVLAAAAS